MTDQLLAVGAAPPDGPALIFPQGTLSYGQLERAASAIAADLGRGRGCGLGRFGARNVRGDGGRARRRSGRRSANPRSGTRELAHMLSDPPELVLVPPGAETPDELSGFGVLPVRLEVDAERVPRMRSRRMLRA